MATGETTTRLEELRKYTISDSFANQYFTGGNLNIDGIDLVQSNPDIQVVYYLGGIKYIDFIAGEYSGKTIQYFTPQGQTPENFIFESYYKDPLKNGIAGSKKISTDVFIERQEIAVFENNYRLEYIKNVNNLTTYAGGLYYNIVNNI